MNNKSTLKALSSHQPWASMIVLGHKPIENRPKPWNHQGPVLIHASLTFDNDGADWIIENFPHLEKPVLESKDLRGGIVGKVNMVDCVTEHSSPWFCGPKGYVFEDPETVTFHPYKGQQGVFNVPWPPPSLIPDRQWYIDQFKGEECQCGAEKRSRMAFCYGCYKALPARYKQALWSRFGEGFEQAYDDAVKWLG